MSLGRPRALLGGHRLLFAVLGIGLLWRAAMVAGLPQPLLTYTDPNAYVRAAQHHLFLPLEGRTAGYPLFLRAVHDVWPAAAVPMVLQHLAALGACGGLYAIARRLEVPAALAVVPAALWAVPIDWLWIEHQLLTETVGAALTVAALAAALLLPTATVRRAAIAGLACAALVAAAAMVRPALLAVVPGVALMLALVAPRPWHWRPAAAATATYCAAFALLAGAYVAIQERETGYTGIIDPALDMGAYVGMAPLADCSRFEVPPGTRSLCERRAPDDRPGTDFYYFDGRSPGRRLATARPDLLPAIDEWGQRAADAQRGELWESRLEAVRQMFGLGGEPRPITDYGPWEMRLDGAAARSAPVTVAAVADYYGADDADVPDPGWSYDALEAAQPWTRPPRPLLLVALLLTVAGAIAGRGLPRRATIALGVVAWLPLLSATLSGGHWYTSVPSGYFVYRYVLPSLPFVGLAAVVAAVALSRSDAWPPRPRRPSRRRTAPRGPAGA